MELTLVRHDKSSECPESLPEMEKSGSGVHHEWEARQQGTGNEKLKLLNWC